MLDLTGLEAERLYFDRYKKSDYDEWLRFYQNKQNRRFLGSETLEPKRALELWLKKNEGRLEKGSGYACALRSTANDLLLGRCGLLLQNFNGKVLLEIGYSVLEEHRGIGLASEASIKALEQVIVSRLAPSVYCIIHHENEASKSVANKMGMLKIDRVTFKNIDIDLFRRKIFA